MAGVEILILRPLLVALEALRREDEEMAEHSQRFVLRVRIAGATPGAGIAWKKGERSVKAEGRVAPGSSPS